MRRAHFVTLSGVSILAALMAQDVPASAECTLKIEPFKHMPKCLGFATYRDGKRTGQYFLIRGRRGDRRWIAAGGTCPQSYPKGFPIPGTNQYQVDNIRHTPTPDCAKAYWSSVPQSSLGR